MSKLSGKEVISRVKAALLEDDEKSTLSQLFSIIGDAKYEARKDARSEADEYIAKRKAEREAEDEGKEVLETTAVADVEDGDEDTDE